MDQLNFKTVAHGALIFIYLLSGCDTKSVNNVEPEIPIQSESFDLAEVQLLEGPFKHAMERNVEYLLFLEPDRFLAWFRKEAGLEPKGEVYGG